MERSQVLTADCNDLSCSPRGARRGAGVGGFRGGVRRDGGMFNEGSLGIYF